MKRRLLAGLGAVIAVSVLAMACTNDSNGATTTGTPTAGTLDPAAILGNLEDVRALVQRGAENIDPMIIADVDYDGGVLTVTLAEGQDGQEATELDSICSGVTSAVALPDLAVVIERADGSTAAECAT